MDAESEYSVNGRTLYLQPSGPVTFDLPIEQVLECGEVLVVLLQVPSGARYPRNIFGIARDGAMLWQVPHLPSRYPTPFRRLVRMGDAIGTGKVEGLEVLIDPQTGRILKKELRRF